MTHNLFYIIAYLQGAAVPDETPNAETLEAFAELSRGGGTFYSGTTEDLFSKSKFARRENLYVVLVVYADM